MGDDKGKWGEEDGHATVDQVYCAGFWVSTGLLRLITSIGNSDLQKIPYHNYCGNRRVTLPRKLRRTFTRVDLSSVTCYDSLSLLHDELRVAAVADRGVQPQRVQRASRQQPKTASFCQFYCKVPPII
jgi:hypothetical protein